MIIDREDAIQTALKNGYVTISEVEELKSCNSDDDFRFKILSCMTKNVNDSGLGEMTMEINSVN